MDNQPLPQSFPKCAKTAAIKERRKSIGEVGMAIIGEHPCPPYEMLIIKY